MKFVSLNRKSPAISFEESLFEGVAPDGGLYIPETIPTFSNDELKRIPQMSLTEIATLTLSKWIGDEIPEEKLKAIVTDALSFPIQFVEVGGHNILELFHGPTLSYRDFASRIITPIMRAHKKRKSKKLKFLLSSYGDAGSALAHSCAPYDDTSVVAVIPKYGESIIKREQLIRMGGNVQVIEVVGNLDDCQRLVRAAFEDRELKPLQFVPGNALSIGQIIPQMIYYVYIYALLYPRLATVVLSASDFGNAYAGLLTRRMGIPFENIVLACDQHNPVFEYVEKGVYHESNPPRVGSAKPYRNPGHFDRILDLCGNSHEVFCDNFSVYEVSESKNLFMVQAIYHDYHYLTNFSTAKAWLAADDLDARNKKVVVLAKLSPLKYAHEIEQKTGIKVDNRAFIESLKQKKAAKVTPVSNDYKQFQQLLKKVLVD